MPPKAKIVFVSLALAAALLGWQVFERLSDNATAVAQKNKEAVKPVPVEVATIEYGRIEWQRAFSGTLQAFSEIVVAPKVSGRIEQLAVDLADMVQRGQVVAKLDNDEFVQALRQAQADLAVAKANLAEAQSLLQIAERELQRIDQLRARGVTSESQRDTAKAEQLAKQAHVEVTRAQATRAEAALETARIRLGYSQVTANWRGGSEQRVVAERFVDEGETVNANAPLLRIVELNPIKVVIHVTERDYALLQPRQSAALMTDAYAEQVFEGHITRIAPVFRESTRQAQVELQVDNPELKLKPGMFVRVQVVLGQAEQASIAPEQALVKRDGEYGVFMVAADGATVHWRPVRLGIRQGARVQIIGAELSGRVVTLGQQLLDDGSAIRIATAKAELTP
jgi:RND family efflux transporter MFP subunit